MARLSYPHNNNDDEPDKQQHQEQKDPKTLAVLGTGSDVGKTLIVCGICRLLSRNGVRVAPFKSQNMSNNASPALITATSSNNNTSSSWGEIGTAQALQAQACGLVPRVEVRK